MDKRIDELKNKIDELERELKKEKNNKEKGEDSEETLKFTPQKALYTWEVPSRVFVRRDRAWYLKIAFISLLLILFFAFLQDLLVILVICVVVLIAFLLGSIPPDTVKHTLSTKGLKSIDDKLYKWKDLKEFWVSKKGEQKIVYIKSNIRFPVRFIMLIQKKDEEKVVKILGEHMDYREFEKKQGWLTRMSEGSMINPKKYEKLFGYKRTKRRKLRNKEKK